MLTVNIAKVNIRVFCYIHKQQKPSHADSKKVSCLNNLFSVQIFTKNLSKICSIPNANFPPFLTFNLFKHIFMAQTGGYFTQKKCFFSGLSRVCGSSINPKIFQNFHSKNHLTIQTYLFSYRLNPLNSHPNPTKLPSHSM